MAFDKIVSHNRFNQEYRQTICIKCGEVFWVKRTSKNKICIPCKEKLKGESK